MKLQVYNTEESEALINAMLGYRTELWDDTTLALVVDDDFESTPPSIQYGTFRMLEDLLHPLILNMMEFATDGIFNPIDHYNGEELSYVEQFKAFLKSINYDLENDIESSRLSEIINIIPIDFNGSIAILTN